MPRRKLIYTHLFPYHVCARSNNKEWFYLSKKESWQIFCALLNEASLRFNFQIHAFVLMDNHYHLIGTTDKNYPLYSVMEWFQRSVNRKINNRAGRINHLFGGPYRASLIKNDIHYLQILKYVYRNPVTVSITNKVESYFFSSLNNDEVALVYPVTGVASSVPKQRIELLKFLNESYLSGEKEAIDKAIRKPEFKLSSRLHVALKNRLN